MTILLFLSLLTSTNNSCLFLPTGYEPSEIALRGQAIFGVGKSPGVESPLKGYSFKHIPEPPRSLWKDDAVLEYAEHNLPAQSQLWVSARGEPILLRNNRLLVYRGAKWSLLVRGSVQKARGSRTRFFFISGHRYGWMQNGVIRYGALPFRESVLSFDVSPRGKLAFLTGVGVYQGKPGSLQFTCHRFFGGHRVIYTGSECLVLGKWDVRRCTGGLWRKGGYDTGWFDGERVWLKSSLGLFSTRSRRMVRCDTGLIPSSVLRVFRGGLVQTTAGLFAPVPAGEFGKSSVPRPGEPAALRTCAARSIKDESNSKMESWRSSSLMLMSLVPSVSLSAGAGHTRMDSDENPQDSFSGSVFVRLQWRRPGTIFSDFLTEKRIREHHSLRRRMKNFERCSTARRLWYLGGMITDPLTRKLVTLRATELAARGSEEDKQ
ncbi:hypothetical protein KKF84_12030 [Myxococcota bacterium]|nr:hypothetical protein [Myxococcota bacterium]